MNEGLAHTADVPATQSPPVKKRSIKAAFRAVWQFIKFMVTLPVVLVRGRRDGKLDEVTVYSAHPSFFLWLLIVVGFVCSAIVTRKPDAAGFCGWLYVWVLLYFIVTLLYDFNAKKLALWVMIFTLIWLTSTYFEAVKHVLVLSSVFAYLASLQPKLDPGTVRVLSWLLMLPWIDALLHMALNGRKKFSPNEISEYHFAEGSEMTDRVGQFQAMVARQPDNELFRFSLAQALIAAGRAPEAESHLAACIAKKTDWMLPRILLGKHLLATGRQPEAKPMLEEALRLAITQDHEDPAAELKALLEQQTEKPGT